MKKTYLIPCLLMPLLLTACGEPSEADIKGALQNSLQQANSVSTMVLGDQGKIEILAVHKLGCDEQAGSWHCTVEVESKLPVIGAQRKTHQLKVAKSEQGWVLVQ
ncbi:hypothetical protein ACFOSS_12970 [Pseudaeromonas sharmana]|uniref:Lipoprotein n=1 Tax=Pseudaeromonas sharmana TaxID=328412 RepID=A0ABV8CQ75_9GAMM